jgi:predicted MFS family arabinose efflux permease
MVNITPVPPAVTAEQISARLERLPLSRWHVKTRVLVGVATFFDGFDQLMIAYALPVLIPFFGLSPGMIAWTIAVGGIGMLLGALSGGWAAYQQATGSYYAYFVQTTSGAGKLLLDSHPFLYCGQRLRSRILIAFFLRPQRAEIKRQDFSANRRVPIHVLLIDLSTDLLQLRTQLISR